MTALLEVRNLVTEFPGEAGNGLRAVDDVSFRLGRGEVLGLVGESGCGKSTLGRSILQLIRPTEGRITLEGKDITKEARRQVALARNPNATVVSVNAKFT